MSHDPAQPSLARRSVLRTAAHSAWAVPAISVAGAAPAFAATGPGDTSTRIVATRSPALPDPATHLTTTAITVANPGPDAYAVGTLMLEFGMELGVNYHRDQVVSQGVWTRQSANWGLVRFLYSDSLVQGTHVLPNVTVPLYNYPPGARVRVTLYLDNHPITDTFAML